MEELINVSYENSNRPVVSGRELHKALEIETPYHKWFPRMCEYGFSAGKDFNTDKNVRVQNEGGREVSREITDHQLTIDMAKELCMLQRTDKGKQFREYFISIENKWNSPEAIMARALQLANNQLDSIKQINVELTNTIAVQGQQITELKPKASYYDVVLNCKDLLSISEIAKDYGKSAKWLNAYLHEHKIQFKQGRIWLLYQKYAEKGYTSTKTQMFNDNNGGVHTRGHTYWTQKGRLFIYDLLKSDGTYPVMECEAA